MKARYELDKMQITLSNVTLRHFADSYVLLKAADDNKNEVTIKLSHEQADFLEAEFRELNRRRRTYSEAEREIDDEEDSYNLFSPEFLTEE